jgi:putative hemolysin
MPLITIEQIEKLIPAFRGKVGNSVARTLMRILSVDTLCDIYDRQSAYEGADFAGACLRDKNINLNYQIGNAERLKALPEGPFITIANHPYGGLDGIVLIDLFGHLREGYKYMVNEVLNLVDKLRPSLIVVNPKTEANGGKITMNNIHGVKEVLQRLHDGYPVGFFPSGAVSDLSLKEMKFRDREWQPSVLRLIQRANVPIIPVRFFDHNSFWFYNLGLISWKVRILQLPHEIVNKRFRRFRIGIGETVSVEEQLKHKDIKEYGAFLREKVYGMPLPEHFIKYYDYVDSGRKI